MSVVRNAFSAFDFSPDDATIDTLRADLALALRKFIESSQMGQTKVGEVLGLKQNVVSQIVRGKIEHLSVERLIRAMVRANISGFAEWGGSPEDAVASAGVRLATGAESSIAFVPTIGTYYRRNWLGEKRASRLSSKPLLQLGAARK